MEPKHNIDPPKPKYEEISSETPRLTEPPLNKKIKLDNISYKIIPKEEASLIEPLKQCPYLGTIKRHLLDFDFENYVQFYI